jgi:hypothetical protein
VVSSKIGRRQALLWSGGIIASGAAGLALWPTKKTKAAYPFARRLGGGREALWEATPDELLSASEEDAARLERVLAQLNAGVGALETLEPRLANGRVGELTANDRAGLRQLWWQVFEPILAIDELKNRYRAWYGLDYLKQPGLHARAFVLSFAALCGQVEAGLRLLDATAGKKVLAALFDEAMPSFGLPARTFSGLKRELGRARDLFFIPLGNEWYERWIVRHTTADAKLRPLLDRLDALRAHAHKRVLTPTTRAVENQVDVVKSKLFVRWFPLQRDMAEWAGDTRFTKEERRLINDAQLAVLQARLKPGDIILERRNWYLSNVGLPGFWPHAALYVGTQAEILKALADVPEVKESVGDLRQHFEKLAPVAWAALGARDHAGHECRVIEAVSEGVVAASIEHSCAADYVAVLRPRVSPLMKLRAVERALLFWGRPYDFNFDFATDDQVVCSELVMKCYERGSAGDTGLEVAYVELVGKRAVPPTEIVRRFRDERGKADAQLEFVYFLEGREREKRAVVATADALAATVDRPKWDIVQP